VFNLKAIVNEFIDDQFIEKHSVDETMQLMEWNQLNLLIILSINKYDLDKRDCSAEKNMYKHHCVSKSNASYM